MQMPEMLDNVSKTVKDDLTVTIKKGDKLSVAAACFSIYAYQALKKQLDGIAELRFIFTSPTFLQEKAPKAKREFYIPRLSRERSLYGTEFEVKLRNELTQKAIARECADWIRKRVQFRSNLTGGNISGFMNVEGVEATTYMPLHGFTTADIGCERGNNIINPVNKMYAPLSGEYIRMFDQIWNDKSLLEDVTEQVIDGITAAYNENSPEFICPNYDRAAQFAPFAALTGYDDAVKETARLTDKKVELDEYSKDALNEPSEHDTGRYRRTAGGFPSHIFLLDKKKSGGAYVTATDRVKKIDEYENIVLLQDGTKIPIDDIAEIVGEVFGALE